MPAVDTLAAGDLDRRIELQRRLAGTDENREPSGPWSTYATVWASFKPATGREFIAARQADTALNATFQIRWRADVSNADRILFGGAAYDIVSIGEIGRRVGLSIMAATEPG